MKWRPKNWDRYEQFERQGSNRADGKLIEIFEDGADAILTELLKNGISATQVLGCTNTDEQGTLVFIPKENKEVKI
jgi:hypothetical protein